MNPTEHEFVCNDVNGNTQWFFNKETKDYYRVYKDGNYTSLGGQYLADPASIEERGKNPQASTVALWNHWKLNKDS